MQTQQQPTLPLLNADNQKVVWIAISVAADVATPIDKLIARAQVSIKDQRGRSFRPGAALAPVPVEALKGTLTSLQFRVAIALAHHRRAAPGSETPVEEIAAACKSNITEVMAALKSLAAWRVIGPAHETVSLDDAQKEKIAEADALAEAVASKRAGVLLSWLLSVQASGEISPTGVCVALIVGNHVLTKVGEPGPSQAKLKQLARCSDKTVGESIGKLVDFGFLSRHLHEKSMTNLYGITYPKHERGCEIEPENRA